MGKITKYDVILSDRRVSKDPLMQPEALRLRSGRSMIRWCCSILLTAVLLLSLSVPALAAEFTLEETAKVPGMDRTWYQGYAPTIQYNTMTLYLPIRAERCEGSITVSLALNDPNVFLLAGEPKSVTVDKKDGIYPVKLSLPLERTRENGDYPATITLQGRDAEGRQIVETMPYILRIRDGRPNREAPQPRILDAVGDLNVGSEGSLRLTIQNPTTTVSMTGAVLTVTDPTGEVQMVGSNLFFLPELLPGETQTVTVPMTVRGNAAIRQHTLEISLRYQALDQEKQWNQSFTVPVAQAIRLEHGSVELPPVIAGDVAAMTLPVMNLGQGELRNVLVKLEIPGVLEGQSVLVGALAAGESKQAKLTFSPGENAVGTHGGRVIITCEDAYGNQAQRTLEVHLTVDKPIPVEPVQAEEQAGISPWTIVLIVLSAALAAGLAVQGKLLTDRIHKLEEERL